MTTTSAGTGPRLDLEARLRAIGVVPVVALTRPGDALRNARTASRNDWGAACYGQGSLHVSTTRPDLEILDRVGGGDSFASGLIYGLLTGRTIDEALEYGAAHGALAMTTPGDTSMATLAEVEQVVVGAPARVVR